MYSKNEHIFMI